MNKEELRLTIHNKIYEECGKGYPFKSKNIDYITNDESNYILGMIVMRNKINDIINEVLNG